MATSNIISYGAKTQFRHYQGIYGYYGQAVQYKFKLKSSIQCVTVFARYDYVL